MNPEYLQPEFDPASLTIPKLKSALMDSGVDLPMKQERKAFYVDLFRREILDKADALQARRKIRPSAAGIMAVSKNGSPQVEQTAELQSQSVSRRRKSTKFTSSTSDANPFQSPAATPKLKVNSPKKPEKFIDYSAASLPIAGYVELQKSKSVNSKSGPFPVIIKQLAVAIVIVALLSVAFGGMAQYYSYYTLPYCVNNSAEFDCKPCPIYAKCDGKDFTCLNGYIFNYRPFPLNSFCSEDQDRQGNIERILSKMSRVLSESAGAYECGYSTSNHVDQETLKNDLKQSFSWPNTQFENYWNAVLDKLVLNQSEYGIMVSGRGGHTAFSSTNPVISLSCRIRKFASDHRYHFFATLIVALVFVLMSVKIKSDRKHAKRRAELADAVITVLIEQEARFRSGQEAKSALSVNHLRDFFLNKEPLKERARLWNEIRQEIMHNSSIRETAILIEGEQHDAWQWIGTSSLLSPNKKR